jgi:hypothetical protein
MLYTGVVCDLWPPRICRRCADRNANVDRKVLSKDGEARPVRGNPTETFTARGDRQDLPSIRVVHYARDRARRHLATSGQSYPYLD